MSVLNWDSTVARQQLHFALIDLGSNEGQFFAGIVKHGPGMKLSSEQWFELLSRLPNRVLRSQLDIEKILSEEQIRKLPVVSG